MCCDRYEEQLQEIYVKRESYDKKIIEYFIVIITIIV